MHDLFQFEAVGQGTQVTLKEHIEPTPLLKPFEHVVAKRARQHTQALLEHLKTRLEHKQGEATNKVLLEKYRLVTYRNGKW